MVRCVAEVSGPPPPRMIVLPRVESRFERLVSTACRATSVYKRPRRLTQMDSDAYGAGLTPDVLFEDSSRGGALPEVLQRTIAGDDDCNDQVVDGARRADRLLMQATAPSPHAGRPQRDRARPATAREARRQSSADERREAAAVPAMPPSIGRMVLGTQPGMSLWRRASTV